MMIWGVASLFQFLLAAGHLRTSILDHQHLLSNGRLERQGDLGWIVANVVVLLVVAMFYARQADSIPVLAGQMPTLVSLLVTNLISLVIWSIRWSVMNRAPKSSP